MRKIVHWVFCLAVFFPYSCKKNIVQPPAQPPAVTDINVVVETNPPILKPITLQINSNIGGFYAGLPFNYSKTSKSYPLLVSIHGGGQYGNGQLDLPVLLNDGLPQLLDEKIFPANIASNGANYSFIVVAPQLRHFPIAQEVEDMIEYARKNYRVDSTRIYLFGLSSGASASCLTAATFADNIAAIVPASGEFNNDPVCTSLAKNKIAIWAFHNDNDPVDNILAANNFISSVNSFNPSIAPRFTVFRADNHDAWTRAINPSYKENGMNIYEWMLQFKK